MNHPMIAGAETLVEQGRRRAGALGRPVLVSRSRPITDPGDPVSLFTGAGVREPHRVLWNHPSGNRWLVGLGAAHVFTIGGPSPFADAKEQYLSLMEHAVAECPAALGVGPVALGGFKFDPNAESSLEWRDFGSGSLVLPRVCYAMTDGGTWLTENALVQPNGFDENVFPAALAGGTGDENRGMIDYDTGHDGAARERWRDAVRRSLGLIRSGEVQKLVLARRLRIPAPGASSIETALRRLAECALECTVFAFSKHGSVFLGASPELLIGIAGEQVESLCLAGSAARGPTPAEDRRIGATLLNDAKEREEHSFVVDSVADSLRGLCSDLRWREVPELLKLGSIQHLATRFHGVNASQSHLLDYVERLHPTPAVAGSPRDRVMGVIRELESMDRGWYAGPVGWVGPSGEGEFSIAIRSALIGPDSAILYSGAGIVEGSDPDREYAETGLKLQTLLSALDPGER